METGNKENDLDYFEEAEEITLEDLEELDSKIDGNEITVSEEELDDDGVDFTLQTIPRLVHVDEQNVTVVCVSDVDVIPASIFGTSITLDRQPRYFCEFCGKPYKSERWFKIHIEGCLQKDSFLTQISKDEEQTLYYVAGYLVFSLKQGMRTSVLKPNPLVTLLESWGTKDSNSYKDLGINEYVRAWAEQVDRGGLFKVNVPQFYQIVVRIEKLARPILNLNLFATYSGENIKEVLKTKFLSCTTLLNEWKSLTISLDENVRSKLFLKLISKWINVRANAFVKVWLQQYKWRKAQEGEKVTEQGEPSLRKGLAKKGAKKIVDRSMISPKKKLTTVKGTPKKSQSVIAANSKVKSAKRFLNKVKKLNL